VDQFIISLLEIKEAIKFEGSIEDLKESGLFVSYCKSKKLIAIVLPNHLNKKDRSEYVEYLVRIAKKYIKENTQVRSWADFQKQKDTRKVHKMLHEYGVTAELFPLECLTEQKKLSSRSKTSLTMPEFYEMCQIQFHFQGSFLSFKKFVQRQYGSFAEYCILKGYDINSSKWESDETAIRVAKKLGSINAVKEKSKSLYKYLVDRKLLEEAFPRSRT